MHAQSGSTDRHENDENLSDRPAGNKIAVDLDTSSAVDGRKKSY